MKEHDYTNELKAKAIELLEQSSNQTMNEEDLEQALSEYLVELTLDDMVRHGEVLCQKDKGEKYYHLSIAHRRIHNHKPPIIKLRELEEQAIAFIRRTLKDHKRPFVSCSFGKDSLVVLHLVHRVNPDIPVLFCNTLVEFPSVLHLKRQLKTEWSLNLIEVFPEKGWTFWRVVNEFGWPIGARNGSRRNDPNRKAVYQCCERLKKAPMRRAVAQYGFDLSIDGLTAGESLTRYKSFLNYGLFNDSKLPHKLHPIASWKVSEVWEYIEKYDIPVPKVYYQETDKYTRLGRSKTIMNYEFTFCVRVGCWPCTLPICYDNGRLQQLRVFYPQLWRVLMEKGLAREIMKRKVGQDDGPWQEVMEQQPCYFDKLT